MMPHKLLSFGVFIVSFLCSPLCIATGNENVFAQRLALAKKIAESDRITGDMGQNFAYIDGSEKNGIILIYEATSSRTKYKTISPVIRISSNTMFMDCSYIKAFDNLGGTISVGGFCRGETKVTRDALEDTVSDKILVTYSSALPWLKQAKKVVNCKSPHGLVYSGIYFVRCQNGNDDELTENITITALSPNFEKIFTVSGYEFAPIKTERKLTFWGIKQGSTHEVIEIKIKNWRVEAPFVRAICPV